MKQPCIIFFSFLSFVTSTYLHGYDLPAVNLGATNILDGGPIRPKPGWYIFQYTSYYHANRWTGPDGNNLYCGETPKADAISIANQFTYQWGNFTFLKASPGVTVGIPVLLYSYVAANTIGIKNGNTGFGDIVLSAYLQWPTIMRGERPIFAHRVQFNVGFPSGEYMPVPGATNPGKNIYTINPYWAATLYFTPRWTLSWRLYYLWCSKNKTTEVRPGDAIHCNYSMAYQVTKKFNVGLNGYFLRQLRNSTLCGEEKPCSKEQAVGVGPGAVYFFSKDLIWFFYAYGEAAVRNRTEGISLQSSLVFHF